ncbi:MAG TPA: glycosyltransferase [Bacteroidota bacterium]|nr:glycosyltransferase [Bacteroidota bacterium]
MIKESGKRDLIVTLAGKDYVDQAKQIFSSVYWNSGWDGDYLLLAHDIPEESLLWFREKGILVYECESIINEPIGIYPSTVLNKLYLFTPYFKKWKTVIYLDGDIIVRTSLHELTKITGIGAAPDMGDYEINFNLLKERKDLYDELCNSYDVDKTGFNSGVMAFNTDIITPSTFSEIVSLLLKYLPVFNGDQPLLNLYFTNITHLPRLFNMCVPKNLKVYRQIIHRNPKGLFHICGENKPWHNGNIFHEEWLENLGKADDINLSKIPPSPSPTTREDILEFKNTYDQLRSAINLKLELSNLYLSNKKEFRKKILSEIATRNPFSFMYEIYYFLISLLPDKIKHAIKPYAVKSMAFFRKGAVVRYNEH